MRKILINTTSLCLVNNLFDTLTYLKRGGFNHYDLSLNYEGASFSLGIREDYIEKAKEIKRFADKLNIKCEQSHLYYATGIDEEMMEKRFRIISQDIKVSKLLGAKICVMHPLWQLNEEENVKFIKRFIPLLHELDIKLALENVWGRGENNKPGIMCSSTPENMLSLINKINDPYVKVCLDLGHAELKSLKTSAVSMIEVLKDNIITLHIHDNDLVNDQHTIPFEGNIEYGPIFEALKNNNYKGNIVFEINRCFKRVPEPLYVPTLKYIHDIGKYFRKVL